MVVEMDLTRANAVDLHALMNWIIDSKDHFPHQAIQFHHALHDVGEQAIISEIARRMADAAPRSVYVTVAAESLPSRSLRQMWRSCEIAAGRFAPEPRGARGFFDGIIIAAIQTLSERGNWEARKALKRARLEAPWWGIAG